jgi:molybdopterin synthase catalytic subunit
MANSLCEVLLTDVRLEAPARQVDLTAGAVVDFWGAVRGLEDGLQIEGIEYEAHRAMAEHQLGLVAEEAVKKFRLEQVIVHHRIGFVGTGEASLFLRVGAEHRAAGFEASQWIVDELKRRAPIWKRPKFKIDNRPAEEGEQRQMHAGIAPRRGRRLQLRR